MTDVMTRLFEVFDPHEALGPHDLRYVELGSVRGSDRLLQVLGNTVRRSSGRTCQLLTGHRGSGKTTELYRLRDQLQDPSTGKAYVVAYCEADDYVDLNDVEYTDVLLAVLQQVWAESRSHDVRLEPGALRTFFEGLRGILTSTVEPKEFGIEVGLAKMAFEIKKNPDNRQLVRAHLRPRATAFLEAVNEVLEMAETAFKAQGFAGLVVMVDNLDRIFRTVDPTSRRTSHDALFIDAADVLRGLACDAILTVPPALLYSPKGTRLQVLYGSRPQMLPMVPVATRAGAPDERGLAKLIEIVERRCVMTGTALAQAFDDPATVRRLCMASGGYVRSLVSLVRGAINYIDVLPITAAVLEQAIRDARDAFVTSILADSGWTMLRSVATTHRISDAEELLQLMEGFAILEYRDGDGPWYDVNPIVREASRFAV